MSVVVWIKRETTMSTPVVIRLRENGPLVIQGPVQIVDHLGNPFTPPPGKETIALCRCGQSKNKPFCDGSHRACGFAAVEVAPTPAPPAQSP
jgi:CDGSH-type Zn-finger protein